MPLIQGSSDAAKSKNISQLMDEGRKQDQAVAIAMDVARRTKRAAGGLSPPRRAGATRPVIRAPATVQESMPWLWAEPEEERYRAEPPPEERGNRAEGGGIGLPKLNVKPSFPRPRLHTGPIHSSVAGRTDHLPIHVPNKAYVLPADIVSGMGQGNTMAGFRIAKQLPDIFHRTLYGQGTGMPYGQGSGPYGHELPHKAGGGSAHDRVHVSGDRDEPDDSGVPIVAAGGEHVYHPREVAKIGNGDVDLGHDVLDAFVKAYRAEHIKTLKSLPGPKHD